MKRELFIEKAVAVHGDRFEYLLNGDVNEKVKAKMRCTLHGEVFEQNIYGHLNGQYGCKTCIYEKRVSSGRISEKDFQKRLIENFSGKVVADYENYSGRHIKMPMRCVQHGIDFSATPSSAFEGLISCEECFFDSYGYYRNTTKEQFIEKSQLNHTKRYDYSCIQYVDMKTQVKILCPEHETEFYQTPSTHVQGRTGCKPCRQQHMSKKMRTPLSEFITKLWEKCGQDMAYLSGYVDMKTNCWLRCNIHETDVLVNPSQILSRNHPCPLCYKDSGYKGVMFDADDLILQARQVHGDSYDYSQVNYQGSQIPVKIRCVQHDHWFMQKMNNHIAGYQTCGKCADTKTSKSEIEIFDYVKKLVPDCEVIQSDRTLIKPLEVDIYIPSKNLAIEFNGNYYHSDVLKDKNYHKNKYDKVKKQNVSLFTVWEHQWDNEYKRNIIKKIISNKLGVGQGKKISARGCEVVVLSNEEFIPFCEKHHLQGSVTKSSVILGLKYLDKLCAVCSFRKLKGRSYSLTRFCSNGIVRGGFSKLLKAFERMGIADKITTLCDNQHFSGNVYKILGFNAEKMIGADYTCYRSNYGVWHKSLWRREFIPLRLAEIGKSSLRFDPKIDSRSEWEVQDITNVYRLWDSGKTRWVKYL